ncbi:MAG: glycosyltransferase family 4 protein [Acidobacteriaceae bacterium]
MKLAALPDSPLQNDPSLLALPHVLLVLDQLPKALGGGERVALKLAAHLPQYGFRASILCLSLHPESPALLAPPCPIYLLPLQRTYDLAALRGAFELRRFLREHQVQIVQTFFESSDIWAGGVTKATSTAKLIWSRRDMGILRTLKHTIAYRLMADAPDAVFTVSEQVRRHCIEVDKIDPDRVQTIYNGLDLSDWDEIERPEKSSGDFVVTTVGNIRRVKGHDIFLRAAASIAVRFPRVQFTLAGHVLEQDTFQELQRLVLELNLGDRFHFVGDVKNLKEHLAASDLFVLPSRSEGFSNAILEAMAASLPVVVTDVGGNSEAIRDGVNGLLTPPEDPLALADAICCLLDNPTQARAMGAAGRATVKQRFTSEEMMRQTARAYSRLLARA